jgi:hypothetical protein
MIMAEFGEGTSMLSHVLKSKVIAVALLAVVTISVSAIQSQATPPPQVGSGPRFKLNNDWPKALPNNWQIGPLTGIYGDSHGLIWTVNQSNHLGDYDLAQDYATGDCCVMAPQVIAFDMKGNVVKSWSVSVPPPAPARDPNAPLGQFQAPVMAGAKTYPTKCDGFKCLMNVHSIYVDSKDNVWIVGNGRGDSHILKFDYNGKFLLQIGGDTTKGCCGNQDGNNLGAGSQGGGTGIAYWPATNEVFVTDGYVNRRVVVYDADTGKFKRMWGAYGKPPVASTLDAKGNMVSPEPKRVFDGPGAESWSTVHGVSITPDGVVWIADRVGNRLQQFKIDGTFIREAFVSRKSTNGTGTVYGFSFSKDPDMKYVYVADGGNKKVHILDRQTLQEVGSFGGCAGQMAGCFNHVHVSATDIAGNVYTGEAAAGARIQRWDIQK